MFKRCALFVALTLVFGANSVFAATAWPAESGVDVGSTVRSLSSAIEPSGLVWHSGRNQLMGVGDEGEVFAMDADGSNVTMWNVSGSDLEDIAVADPSSNYVYLADENGRIMKYNLSSSSVTQTWSVTTWMPEVTCPGGSGTCGMEALTYADGYFYAGYQYNGKIYKLDLSGTTASKVDEFAGLSSNTWDISGLTYKDNYLYALYSGTLAVMDLQGNVKASYSVPGTSQEGVALGMDSNGDGDANIFIAEDGTGKVYSYDNFPIYGWTASATEPVDPDNDGDGVPASSDCNDNDADVSSDQTFYTDLDEDGLGSDTTASICYSTAPSGYSSNSNDTNDSIPNAGVEIGGDKVDNDGDGKVDEANTVASNGYHPYYSLLDAGLSRAGKITNAWALRFGDFGVRYGDGSIYRYSVTTSQTRGFSRVKAIPGTAIFKVTVDGVTYKVNGYTGRIVH